MFSKRDMMFIYLVIGICIALVVSMCIDELKLKDLSDYIETAENESSSLEKELITTLEELDSTLEINDTELTEESTTVTIIDSDTEIVDENKGIPLENLVFTVDITDNFVKESKLLVGNTSTTESYSGVIMIYIDDGILNSIPNIIVGNTYIIETTPMMTMSIPPQVTAVNVSEASENEILELENVREQISNFTECMLNYANMELNDIITDANINYATWTQDEIVQYKEFIKELGYTDDNMIKSYVNTRDNIGGSYLFDN